MPNDPIAQELIRLNAEIKALCNSLLQREKNLLEKHKNNRYNLGFIKGSMDIAQKIAVIVVESEKRVELPIYTIPEEQENFKRPSARLRLAVDNTKDLNTN